MLFAIGLDVMDVSLLFHWLLFDLLRTFLDVKPFFISYAI